jgi:hypothetical protein
MRRARSTASAPLTNIFLGSGQMKPWRQARPYWDFAVELLLRAAKTGKRRDVEAATAQMEFALRVEGWMAARRRDQIP